MKKNKWINLIAVLVIICSFTVFALGSGEDGKTDDQGKGTAETAENAENTAKAEESKAENVSDGKGNLGDYDIEIKSCRIAKDYEGNDVVIVKYGFTNNSDKATSFAVAMHDTVFQNGVELESAFVLDEDADFESENYMKDIKGGATIDVEKAFKLDDATSDIEVEVKELISLNNDMVKKTFSIAQ